MIILEAFKAGTLVIASRIGSISNIISHMNTGILFKPGDVNDLKNKINWVLDNLKNVILLLGMPSLISIIIILKRIIIRFYSIPIKN